MAQPNALLIMPTPQQYRLNPSDSVRRRALARLYERRSVVDELIASLERYQTVPAELRASCVEINAGKRSS
jgi:hypothetical protein